MKEFIEKLIARLEEEKTDAYDKWDGGASYKAYSKSIEIVNQLAEEMGVAKNAITTWIPISERLPEYAGDYLVTQYNSKAIDEYCNGSRISTIFFDNNGWWDDIDFSCGWEIIAWQPLPQPYVPKGENV